MQPVSINTILIVIGLVLFAIIMIWWSSSLMLARRRVGGGAHLLLLGSIISFDAGVKFYEVADIGNTIGLAIVTFMVVMGSWLYEIKLRRREKENGVII